MMIVPFSFLRDKLPWRDRDYVMRLEDVVREAHQDEPLGSDREWLPVERFSGYDQALGWLRDLEG